MPEQVRFDRRFVAGPAPAMRAMEQRAEDAIAVIEAVARPRGRRRKHPRSRAREKFLADLEATKKRLLESLPLVNGRREALVVRATADGGQEMILLGKSVLNVGPDKIIRAGHLPYGVEKLYIPPPKTLGKDYETYIAHRAIIGRPENFKRAVCGQARKILSYEGMRFAQGEGAKHDEFIETYNRAVKTLGAHDFRGLPWSVKWACIRTASSPGELRRLLGRAAWKWLLRLRGVEKFRKIAIGDGQLVDALRLFAIMGVFRPMSLQMADKAIDGKFWMVFEPENRITSAHDREIAAVAVTTLIRSLEAHRKRTPRLIDLYSKYLHSLDVIKEYLRRTNRDINLTEAAAKSLNSLQRWLDLEDDTQRVLREEEFERQRRIRVEDYLARGEEVPRWLAEPAGTISNWGAYFQESGEADGYRMDELNSCLAILQEGHEMGHCVGNYRHGASVGDLFVFSIYNEGKEDRATLEVGRGSDGVLEARQLRTHCNAAPSDKLTNAAMVLVSRLRMKPMSIIKTS